VFHATRKKPRTVAGLSVAQVPGELRQKNQEKMRIHERHLTAPPQPIAAPLLFAADFSRVLLNQRDLKLSDWSAELSCLPVK
jgi:hypothetical protein